MGRWSAVDPLAESYINHTPYSYVMSNPILMIDPNGMSAYRYNWDTGEYENEDGEKVEWNEVKGALENGGKKQEAKEENEKNSPNYIFGFDYEGNYEWKLENDNNLIYFRGMLIPFADPIHTPKELEWGTYKVRLVTKEEIFSRLQESGVYDISYLNAMFFGHLSYALKSSRSGKMDYTGYLDFGEIIHITEYKPNQYVAHDNSNFGNFLWGAGMASMRVGYLYAFYGSHVDQFFFDDDTPWELDTIDDQRSIVRGYQWASSFGEEAKQWLKRNNATNWLKNNLGTDHSQY